MPRTRFAPSPTGDLHLGGALVALASWWLARVSEGAAILRVEDLDPPRVVRGAERRILEDLEWLGLSPWGDAILRQSERGTAYEAAISELDAKGLVYPCDCSRSEIARVASAPHAGEEMVYPGTCRDADPARPMKRQPALRIRVPAEPVTIIDELAGEITQVLSRDVGDFVLKRGDGVYAYQLAVVVDDVAQGVDHIIRGADLLASSPRQAWLAQVLTSAKWSVKYTHVPLAVDAEGERIAKRSRGGAVRALRAAGVMVEEILGLLGHALGLTPDAGPVSLDDLCALACGASPFAGARELRIPRAWASLGTPVRGRMI